VIPGSEILKLAVAALDLGVQNEVLERVIPLPRVGEHVLAFVEQREEFIELHVAVDGLVEERLIEVEVVLPFHPLQSYTS
jgi:hypothetical protein